MPLTVWKPISSYEGSYEVSNTGLVKSCCRTGVRKDGTCYPLKGRLLKLQKVPGGYLVVYLYDKAGKRFTASVHRLVAEAFIPNPENLPEVNHEDGDKTNNYFLNLSWVSSRENTAHAYRLGLLNNKGESHYKVSIPDAVILEALRSVVPGVTIKSVATLFGIPYKTFHLIYKGKSRPYLLKHLKDEKF